jgi:hypothetical protein
MKPQHRNVRAPRTGYFVGYCASLALLVGTFSFASSQSSSSAVQNDTTQAIIVASWLAMVTLGALVFMDGFRSRGTLSLRAKLLCNATGLLTLVLTLTALMIVIWLTIEMLLNPGDIGY